MPLFKILLLIMLYRGNYAATPAKKSLTDKTPAAVPAKKQTITSVNNTTMRGATSPYHFDEKDFKAAHGWNINLIRWQLAMGYDEKKADSDCTDLIRYHQWLNHKLNELDLVLKACAKYKIKAIVELHALPGGRFKDGSIRMSTIKQYNDDFLATWTALARRYKGNKALYAYDLINEPFETSIAAPGLDYVTTETKAAAIVRNIDAKTPILFESGFWDRPGPYAKLKPLGIPGIIYEVHMYDPIEFTHQGIYFDLRLPYPGIVKGVFYDKSALKNILKPLRDFQLKYKVKVLVGEFSAARWAPGAVNYLTDCINIFEEYGWDWAYHAFREASCWSVEYEDMPEGIKTEAKPAQNNTDRKNLLLKYYNRNKNPYL